MKSLMLVTASYPYGPGEGFLVDEIDELSALVPRITLAPAFPRGELRSDYRVTGNVELVPGSHLSALRARPVSAMRSVAGSVSGGEIGIRHAPRNAAGAMRAATVNAAAQRNAVDHIHAYWLSVPSGVALRVSRASGIPWSASAHRFDIFQANGLRLKLARAAFVRTISHLGAEHLRRQNPRASVEYVPLGIVQPYGAAPPPAGSNRVLCAANFVPIKGHEHLLQAIGLMQRAGVDVRLDLAGEGPTQDAAKAQVRQLGIRGVNFLGQLQRGEILEGYRSGRWRATVLPSVDLGGGEHEGVPISLVEAMSNGIPAVSTRSGSITDLMAAAGPYALVPAGSPQPLADALTVLLRSDEEWTLASRRAISACEPWRVERTAARLVALMQHPSA